MKKANFTFLLLLLLMGVFSTSSVHAQCGPNEDTTAPTFLCSNNLIANGDFEAGDNGVPPQGFMSFGPTFKEFINSPDPVNAPTSSYGKIFVAGNGVSGIFQSFPAAPGESFTYSADIVNFSFDALAGNTFAVSKLEFFDASGASTGVFVESAPVNASSPQDVTIRETLTAVAPSNAASVQLLGLVVQFGGGGGAAFFDNFVLVNNSQATTPVITVEATADLTPVVIDNPQVSDNCPGDITVTNDFNNTTDASGDFPLGTTTITFTAEDAQGNTNDVPCTFEVVVEDTTAPTLDICSGDVLENGDFEEGTTPSMSVEDWGSFGNTFTEFINSPAPATAPTSQYVKIFGQFNGVTNVGGFFQSSPAQPGEVWEASMDMVNFSFDAMQPNNRAVVRMVFRDAANNEIAGTESDPLTSASPQNVLIPNTLSLEAPAGTVAVELFGLFIQNDDGTPTNLGGAAFFDNATLVRPQPIVSVEAAFGECETDVLVEVVATDATTTTVTNDFADDDDDTDDNASGLFPVGITVVNFTATDAGGNETTCAVTVNVALNSSDTPAGTVCVCEDGTGGPSGGALACNDLVNVSADENCQVIITPDLILEGDIVPGCYNVTVDGEPMNVVDASAPNVLGETLLVMITAEDGNACWGNIIIEDKAAPVLECEDLTIECTDSSAVGEGITADDNCSTADIQLIDESTDDDAECSTGVIITRQYIAIDGVGNVSAPCTQTITITRVTDVDFPEDIAWSCDDFDAFPGIIDAQPLPGSCNFLINDELGGVLDGTNATNFCLSSANNPNFGSGAPDVSEGIYCNFAVTSSDDILELCGDNPDDNLFKIVRTWTVLDWCTNTLVTTGASGEDNVQVIKVVDVTAPIITVGAQTVSANQPGEHPQPCVSIAALATAVVSDNCGDVTYTIFTPVGQAVTQPNNPNSPVFTGVGTPFIPSAGLPIGTYNITYVATDACGNTSELTVELTVVDDITPTPVCDEITQVAIGADGEATVFAETFDDGSNDNCGIDRFEVRRMSDLCGRVGNTTFDNDGDPQDSPIDPDNGEFVTFCCEDIGNETMVVLRVFDFFGNYNECMVNVLVEDKIAPFKVQDVDDFTITCDDFFTNFQPALDVAAANGDTNPQVLIDAFGDVEYADNCDTIVTRSFVVDVNTCGQGTITRTFNVTDPAGNVNPANLCTQTITVLHINDWSINFPEDVTLECLPGEDEVADMDFGEPNVFDDDCELVAISMEDAVFDVVPDACYKIIRTWTAINWCIYDGTESSVVNLNNPLGAGNDDRLRANCLGRGPRYYEEGGADSGGLCSQLYNDTDIVPVFVDDDRNNDDGIIVYTQVIKVNDDVAPVITNPGTLDFCIDGSTDADGDCDRNVTLPEVEVTDCVLNEDLTVTYTVAGLGTGLNYTNVAPGTYTVTVTAIDNCGNQSTIEYDFVVRDCKAPTPYCVGGLVVELMPMDEDGDGMSDMGMVEIWANDFNAGSFDNCTDEDDLVFFANIAVDNFADATTNLVFDCGTVGQQNIYMYVQDEAGNVDYCLTSVFIESVPNVCPVATPLVAGALATENNAPVAGATVSLNSGAMTTSAVDGSYALNAVTNEDVTVTPEYDVYDNSVTTFDLLLIRKHILTTELLDSPYKMIAADVNNSQSITAADLVLARQVILGMAEGYTNNNAWVFVDAAYEFPADWTLTDGYPPVASFNNIASDQTANFVAVRVGDVNGTFGFADEADERNSMTIRANDAALAAGQEVTVEFSSADAVAGYQFTLDFAGLEVVAIDGNQENFGVFADAITTSFSEEKAGDRLFSVTFRATQDVVVSEALALTDRITTAEAYSANGAMEVVLEFANSATDFALYQNTPNPVSDYTVIGFNLPTAGAANVTVSDVNGKVITVLNGDYAKGYNEVTLNNLPAGVMTYTLQSADFSATKTMVVVK